MTKQLVVVVHGVGVREAGVSSVMLAASLDGDPPIGQNGLSQFNNRSSAQLAEDALRPHSADDFLLRERPAFNRNGKYSTFPARVSRYQSAGNTGAVRERVIADFYWGDITGTGGDVLRVVTGIFRLMLGLSHAVRENAWSVFQADTGRSRFWRNVGATAVLTVHGPIFALNLMLGCFAILLGLLNLAGVWSPAPVGSAASGGAFWLVFCVGWAAAGAAVTAMRTPAKIGGVVLGLIAAVAILASLVLGNDREILLQLCILTVAAGVILRLRSQAFLLRHLADWLCICGLATIPFLYFDCLSGWVLATVVEVFDLSHGRQNMNETLLVQTARVLVLAAVVSWVLVVLSAGLLLMRRMVIWRPGLDAKVDFQAEAIGLMMVLWLLVTGVFWGAGLKLAKSAGVDFGGSVDEVYRHLLFVPVAIGAFLVLVGLMGMQFATTTLLAGHKGAVGSYVANRKDRAETGRLVVAPWAIRFLRFLVAGALVIVLLLMTGILEGVVSKLGASQFFGADNSDVVGWSLGVLAGAGALAIGVARGALGAGIGIAIDVLSYINSYSWNSWQDVLPDGAQGVRNSRRIDRGEEEESRTLLERLPIPWLRDAPSRRKDWGYWLRRRIQDRLRVLVAGLIVDEQPDEVLIVSHSQGTMIALDVVDLEGRQWLTLGDEKLTTVKLVTMGSPYTHVYSHYFPRSFPPPATRAVLGPKTAGGVLERWVNIFRIDDFIGTHIDPDMASTQSHSCWPREVAVPRNGHTMYWIDARVARILRKVARF